jgi:hypothetical protein
VSPSWSRSAANPVLKPGTWPGWQKSSAAARLTTTSCKLLRTSETAMKTLAA